MNCKRNSKSLENAFRISNIWNNIIDIMIILVQTYCFALKLCDANTFDVDPKEFLSESQRRDFYPLHFIGRNYHDFCVMETIGLIFIALKILDGFRINQRINVIFMTLSQSVGLMFTFLAMLVAFHIALVPMA